MSDSFINASLTSPSGSIGREKHGLDNTNTNSGTVDGRKTKTDGTREDVASISTASAFGSQFLNEGASFPKNWTYVQKLQKQRQLLHQQLFAKRQGSKNTSKQSAATKMETDINKNDIKCESDSDSSDDPHLVIAESNSSLKNGNKDRFDQGDIDTFDNSEDCDSEATEFYDSSDLCLLSPSKINNALNEAITSVNHDEHSMKRTVRIKDVLNKLKIKAECNVRNINRRPSSYTVSKPDNLPVPTSTATPNVTDSSYLFVNKTVEEARDTTKPMPLQPDLVKYFGLSYKKVTDPSQPNIQANLEENVTNQGWNLSKDRPQNIDISTEIDTATGNSPTCRGEDPIDYTNIAFQKLMADKRLKPNSEVDDNSQKEKTFSDQTNEENCQDLKMFGIKSKSGTTSADIEVKDASNLNQSENERNHMASIYERMRECTMAQMKLIEAKKRVNENKLHVLELQRQCMEMNGGNGSLTPSPILSPSFLSSSPPSSTDEEYFKELKTNNETQAKRKEVRKRRITSGSQSNRATASKNVQNNGNKVKSVTESITSPWKSDRIASGSPCTKSCICSPTEPISENLIPKNPTVSGHNSRGVNEREKTATSSVPSQSVLDKHLHQHLSLVTAVLTSGQNSTATQPPRVATCQTVNSTAKYILSSKNEVPNSILNLSMVSPHIGQPPVATQARPTLISQNSHPSDPTKSVIMPIGCVKDESTNQVYPTYQYNGFTFALINNKMYYIRMNSFNQGNPGPSATASLRFPTQNSNIVMPARPNFVPVSNFNARSHVVNIRPRPRLDTKVLTSRGVQLASYCQSYRLPSNQVVSASTSHSGPVNFVLVSSKSGETGGQNLQGLEPGTGYIVGANIAQGMSCKILPKQLGPIPAPIPSATVASQVITTSSTCNVQHVMNKANQKIVTAHPAVVKVPFSNTCSKQACKKITGKTTNATKVTQPAISSKTSHNSVKSSRSEAVKTGNKASHNLVQMVASSPESMKEEEMLRLGEQISKKRKRKRKSSEKDTVAEAGSSKIPVEPVDDGATKHKRKRKGTPTKKVQKNQGDLSVENSPQNDHPKGPKLLLDVWLAEKEELQKKDKNMNEEPRVETPVPFVNYPARIVSKQSEIDGSKIVSIVGSKKNLKHEQTCSGSDSSINEEKMVKLLQFADELEQEKDSKTMSRGKRRFKRRRRESRQSFESADNTSSDSESKTPNKNVEDKNPTTRDTNDGFNSPSTEAVPTNTCAPLTERRQVIASPQSEQHKMDSNVSTCSNIKGSQPKKEQEFEDQYDSSDLENYENFLLTKAKNSIKRKSQLIESYYTAEGLNNRQTSSLNNASISNMSCSVSTGGQRNSVTAVHCETKKYTQAGHIQSSTTVSSCSAYSIANACSSKTSVNNSQHGHLVQGTIMVPSGSTSLHSGQLGVTCEGEMLKQNGQTLPTNVVSPLDNGPSTPNTSDSSSVNFHHGLNQMTGNITRSVGSYSTLVVNGAHHKCQNIERMFTRTKLISLKGEMCERWTTIKSQTGFGEMSDPQFLQYLLRLEEERQFRIKRLMAEMTAEEDPLYYEDTGLSEELSNALTSTPICSSVEPFSPISPGVNVNNNSFSSPCHEVDIALDYSDGDDTLVDVVNMSAESPRFAGDSLTKKFGIYRTDNMEMHRGVQEAITVSPMEVDDIQKRAMNMEVPRSSPSYSTLTYDSQ